jgi:hypothetical protein
MALTDVKKRVPNTANLRKLARQFGACPDAIAWATSECRDAAEVWQNANAARLLWIALRPGILTSEELREFAEAALVETPPPEKDLVRIRACLDATDGLSYPTDCPRERWAALAVAARGQLSDLKAKLGDVEQVQAKILRRICPQPFAEEGAG